jgi:hypothetical protein
VVSPRWRSHERTPSLLTELQLGAFFNAYWPSRLLRRVLSSAPVRFLRSLPLAVVADAAFWAGARSAATDAEWTRFTGSSYVVLTYHRLAGERVPGQERLDVDPAMFRRHLPWLRRLAFRPLSRDELAEFHANPSATLPRRSFVLTANDGFRDAVAEIHGHISAKPQLFVNTACVGGVAPWADDRPLASWDELRELAAAGTAIGSHARTHALEPRRDYTDVIDVAAALDRLLAPRMTSQARSISAPAAQCRSRSSCECVSGCLVALSRSRSNRSGGACKIARSWSPMRVSSKTQRVGNRGARCRRR